MLLGLCIRSCEAVLAAVYNTGTVAVDCYHDAGLVSDCEETADVSEMYSWDFLQGLETLSTISFFVQSEVQRHVDRHLILRSDFPHSFIPLPIREAISPSIRRVFWADSYPLSDMQSMS